MLTASVSGLSMKVQQLVPAYLCVGVCWRVLQYVAVCCTVFHCVAVLSMKVQQLAPAYLSFRGV